MRMKFLAALGLTVAMGSALMVFATPVPKTNAATKLKNAAQKTA